MESEQQGTMMMVEIEVTDREEHPGFALGTGPTFADSRAMAAGLAAHLGLEPPPNGCALRLALPGADVMPILDWISKHYPDAAGTTLDKKPATPLAGAPPSSKHPVSPWRQFALATADDVEYNSATVCAVAVMVDLMFQQVSDWQLDPTKAIGGYLYNTPTPLRVTIVPAEQTVYVDTDCPEANELPYDKMMKTPFDMEPKH